MWPKNDTIGIGFKNEGGVASLEFTKAATIFKALTSQMPDTHYNFRGIGLDIQPTVSHTKSFLNLVGGGHFFQFQVQSADYDCVQDHHVWAVSESEKADDEGSIETTISGVINALPAADTLTDSNKAWVVNTWVSGAPNKYGLIVIKNPVRPAAAVSHNSVIGTIATLINTYTNDNLYNAGERNAAPAVYFEYTFNTSIDPSDISKLKVKCIFEEMNGAFGGGASGKAQIYNYIDGGGQWDTLKTFAGAQVYLQNFEALESGTILDPTKHIKADGEVKVRFTAATYVHAGVPRSKIRIYYIRVEHTYTEFPTLQFDIESNTATTLTTTANLADVDPYDYYIIGIRTSSAIKALLGAYDTWQALTTTNIIDGTKFASRAWTNEKISQMLNYLIALENWDCWIDDTLDVHTQSTATSSGLRFDETNINLQFVGWRGAILGSQLYNRIKVEWANGTVTVNDTTSQTTYGHVVEHPPYVDKHILNSEDATVIGTNILTRYADPDTDIVINMTLYTRLEIGQSIVVNFPSHNISNVTYVIREIVEQFMEDGRYNAAITLGVPGSPAHSYNVMFDEFIRLKQEMKETKQLVNTQSLARASTTSSTETEHVFLDEDDMVSDREDAVASQQSIKAYADAKVSDVAYAATWDGVTAIAPSKNAVYDECVALIALINGILTSANAISVKPSGDTDDYLQFSTAADQFIMKVIGETYGRLWLASDYASQVNLVWRDDAAGSNYGQIGYHKTSHYFYILSDGDLQVWTNNDTNDYLYFHTASNVAALLPCEDNVHSLGSAALAYANIYAYVFNDLTPGFDLPTAQAIVNSIEVANGKIDHAKLHPNAKIENKVTEPVTVDTGEKDAEGKPIYRTDARETGEIITTRNLGACVTALLQVVKDQEARIKTLEAKVRQ